MAFSSNHGRFVWRDLMTSDGAAARDFYTRLFGWSVKPMDMHGFTYLMLGAHGRDFGGIVQEPGVPPHWIAYVSVDDLDATLARVPALGGNVCVPATPIPNVGRFAVVADPEGAVFSPMQLDRHGPHDRHPVPDHTFSWTELRCADPGAVAPFYESLFGWRGHPEGDDMVLFMLPNGDHWSNAAKMDAHERPAWIPYVATADVDGDFAKAKALGATAYVEPTEIPGVARFAVLADPQQAVFTLWHHKRG